MTEDTYREHLNDLQLEVEELRAKLKEAQTGDTISRQAALKCACADSEIYIAINNLPSAQPEIIRCKDCKWFGDIGCAICIVDDSDKPTENDFCSFAERRPDD